MKDAFVDVIGHGAAIGALRADLARTGGAGSTLLAGPEGVGRFLLAHRAARAILGTTAEAAARVDAFGHADLHVVTPAEGIDGVRRLRETLARRPTEGPRRVLLVRDADRFSLEALNALLKTLEEPPAGAAIYLVAEAADFLPETVVSRCRVVRLLALSEKETEAVLLRCGESAEAAREADGAPGRALLRSRGGVSEDADRLLELLERRGADPLVAVDRLQKLRSGEDRATQRRRLAEVFTLAAARLRPRLPGSEAALRSLVEALGSLQENGNPSLLLTELALHPWKRKKPN